MVQFRLLSLVCYNKPIKVYIRLILNLKVIIIQVGLCVKLGLEFLVQFQMWLLLNSQSLTRPKPQIRHNKTSTNHFRVKSSWCETGNSFNGNYPPKKKYIQLKKFEKINTKDIIVGSQSVLILQLIREIWKSLIGKYRIYLTQKLDKKQQPQQLEL